MDRIVRTIACLLLAVAAAVGAFVAHDVMQAVGTTVPGFAVMEMGSVGPRVLVSPDRQIWLQDLQPQDRVVSIDGAPVGSGRDLSTHARSVGPGVPVRYEFERDGSRFERTIPTATFTWADARGIYLPIAVVGLMILGLGGLPVLRRPGSTDARVFLLFAVGLSVPYSLGLFDHFHTYRFWPWIVIFTNLSKAAFLHLALLFPQPMWPLSRWPRALPAILYSAMGLQAVAYAVASSQRARWADSLEHLTAASLTLAVALLTVNVVRASFFSDDPEHRRQGRLLLPGAALLLPMIAALFATTWGFATFAIPPVVYVIPVFMILLGLAYAMAKHNLFELDAIARRILTAGAFGLAVTLSSFAVFSVLRWALGVTSTASAIALGLGAVLVAIPVLAPFRGRMEDAVIGLFPQYRRASETVHAASRELARLREEPELVAFLRRTIREITSAASVRILIGDPEGELIEMEPESGAALRLETSDPVHRVFSRGRSVNFDGSSLRRTSRGLRLRASSLRSRLVVALPPAEHLAGGLLLGRREDGRLYTADDLRLLETLAAQAATAIENARSWSELQSLKRRLEDENVMLREELGRGRAQFEELVGDSSELREVIAQIEQVAPTDASVLVQGETGTGKELVVRAIHERSRRRDGPLVKLGCGAIPESLLESELFGHERGAFTGADQMRRGRFEAADGGTLFFDDVDTLPLGVQAKLLRAIQEGEVQRLGSDRTHTVDVRIIAATNTDLLERVEQGLFREDLFYRLNVVPIPLPPLRERTADLPLLVRHFVEVEGTKANRPIRGIAPGVLEELATYDWPGNIRELRNAIERAVVMSTDGILRLTTPLCVTNGHAADPDDGLPLAEQVRRFKVRKIEDALARSGGNQREAADILGMHRPNLTRMITTLGIRETDEE